MAKKKRIRKYPDGGPIENWQDYWQGPPPDGFGFDGSIHVLSQLFEGIQNEKMQKPRDIFTPMQGFHGFNYADGGQINPFNNQMENSYPLSSYLPFILDDPRNTVNAGGRKPIPIQTEKGEMISSPLGDLVNVASKKKHKHMESDEVTDVTAEENYILSNSKTMSFKKGQKVAGIDPAEISLGRSPIYYKEGEIATTPKEYKFSDVQPNKSKYTPADVGRKIARKYPLTTRTDAFAVRAQVENKQSRIPYIKTLVSLSELKRPKEIKEVPKFAFGGPVGPMDKAIKFGKFQIPSLDNLYQLPQFNDGAAKYNALFRRDGGPVRHYPYGGEAYDYNDETHVNRRRQWNRWLDQASNMYQDFYLNDVAKANDASSLIEAGAILGQNKYKGDNEFLYGNQFFSRLQGAKNEIDRSMNVEQEYFQNAGNRENSIIRQGLNAGLRPEQLASLRGNAIAQGNERIATLGGQRRQYMDKYNSTALNATDMYAGRRNSQKAYEVDFENNRLQNLAGVATKNIAGRLAAKSGALNAATQYQLGKTPGTDLSDFAVGVSDAISMVSNIANIGATLFGAGGLFGGGGGGNNGGSQGGGTFRNTSNFANTGYSGGFSTPGGYSFMPYNGGFNSPIAITPTPSGYDPMGWRPGWGYQQYDPYQ